MNRPPLQDQNCSNCRYWRKGSCRRHAPLARAFGDSWDWAKTNEDEWCGEWVAL